MLRAAVTTDPFVALVPVFAAAFGRAFGPAWSGVDPVLRRSSHADVQANGVLALRGRIPGNPRELAEAVRRELAGDERLERVEVAGPGFLNLTLRSSYLDALLADAAPTLGLAPGASETVVVDYSSPNLAKEMHVGHLRSTIIGDCLVRVFEACGHRVIRQNHLGDWGTPLGMLIEHLRDERRLAVGGAIDDLGAFYQAARAKFDGDPAFAERARQRVVALQGGDPDTLALWRGLVDATLAHVERVYARLGVKLERADVRGESAYNALLPTVVDELAAAGLLRESDGALCAFPAGFASKEGTPLPLIVRKRDGGFGYAATDLAALRFRCGTLGATRLVYVVGAPQAQHLAMVFAVARAAGWLPEGARAEHVAFGSVLGRDGKMLKSRAGENVKLAELLDEAVERARAIVDEKSPELPAAERAAIASAVGIGAVKYGDLASDRHRDYVFDWSRLLAFDGNTAPYLQYAHARIRSLLRKAGAEQAERARRQSAFRVSEPAERALALGVLRFPTVVAEVAESLEPHRLATYLYETATAFSGFYESCPVLRAPDDATREHRLALAALTARVLARGLDLLGIDAPARM